MSKKKLLWRNLFQFCGVMMLSCIFFVACDTGNKSQTQPSPTVGTTMMSGSAVIKHSPEGIVELTWDNLAHTLQVYIALTGLSQNSAHPAFLQTGSCKHGGKVLYDLTVMRADDIGFASETTTLKNISDSIPASGWFVDVTNGPENASPMQKMDISCADITNTTPTTSGMQKVQATLGNSSVSGQSASGIAKLTVDDDHLTVMLSAQNLVPGSKHAVHIHAGSCASQGKVVYTLNPVVVNAAGDGTSTTVIPNISAIPRSGWYINIHEGSMLTDQMSSDPVACGDVTSLH